VFQGAGERRDEYKRRAAEIGVSNVEFRATVSRSSMHEVYEQADAAIHLFRRHPYWRCALSSKVFDYMVHGKPVVFAGEGDIADLLHQSGAGIAVPPESPEHLADAIMTLYESPELCDQMGARGKRYVEEHFSRAAIRDQLREALNV
jgi:glycosyltransferase involved in cell wall biosynthesis